ncbi:MAG: mycofactocin biosynthesis peptidyl-dipeptidase MftE [Actinomycetota bacterium]
MAPIHLGAATSSDIADGPPRAVLVPLGATEQHGPHLPLDTDTRIAEAWAGAMAEVVPGAVVAPTLPYGSSGEHDGFTGTLSIGQAALELTLVELGRSASHLGALLVLVSGHAGNVEPVRRAEALLTAESRAVLALFPGWPEAEGPIDAHAGWVETSLLLHLAPEAVRLDRAAAGATEPIVDLLPRLRAGGVASVAPNGVLGDPAGASAAAGADLLGDLVARGAALITAALTSTNPTADR